MKPEHQGDTFTEFLDGLGIREEIENRAVKAILADQIRAAMAAEGLSKTAMALRMKTSRRALDRLLDPDNDSVTLYTLQRAASAVGRRLQLQLV